jgi:hypothetical protein
MLNLLSVAAYGGFQWTVHVLVYRQFSAVPPDAFPAYERLHQQRISRLVGPLFAALGMTTGWLILDRPAGVPLWSAVTAAGLVAVILLVTGLGAVPLHRRLSRSWDAGSYRSLLRVDLVRTLLATVNLALAATLALQYG